MQPFTAQLFSPQTVSLPHPFEISGQNRIAQNSEVTGIVSGPVVRHESHQARSSRVASLHSPAESGHGALPALFRETRLRGTRDEGCVVGALPRRKCSLNQREVEKSPRGLPRLSFSSARFPDREGPVGRGTGPTGFMGDLPTRRVLAPKPGGSLASQGRFL